MLKGYIWVSETDPDKLHEQQTQALLEVGVPQTQIYEDLRCPRQHNRPKLQTCLQTLETGDTLVVWQLERLVKSRAHLLDILQTLWQREIGLTILQGKGTALNTVQIRLKQAIDVIDALSEVEAQIVAESTKAGLANARAQGKELGATRKVTASVLRQAIQAITHSNRSVTNIAKEMGITRATLYIYLNGDGTPKPAGQKILDESKSQENADT